MVERLALSKNTQLFIRAGDVETKTGPQLLYELLKQQFHGKNRQMKFLHIHSQSVTEKRFTLLVLTNELENNIIYGIKETWFLRYDDEMLWGNDQVKLSTVASALNSDRVEENNLYGKISIFEIRKQKLIAVKTRDWLSSIKVSLNFYLNKNFLRVIN